MLITLDDPDGAAEEGTFNHQTKDTLEYLLGQWFPAGCRFEPRAEAASDNDASKVTFWSGRLDMHVIKIDRHDEYFTERCEWRRD